MVEDGQANRAIYEHVQQEYGPDQIAVPRRGYMHRISYGLPYVAVGLMFLTVYWLGWTWWVRSRELDPSKFDEEDEQTLDRVEESIDSALD